MENINHSIDTILNANTEGLRIQINTLKLVPLFGLAFASLCWPLPTWQAVGLGKHADVAYTPNVPVTWTWVL